MIHFYAEIHHIDYDKLKILPAIKKPLAKLAKYRLTMKPVMKLVSNKLVALADEYGISFSAFEIAVIAPTYLSAGKQNPFSVSASIGNIDYNKLLDCISESMLEKKLNNNDDKNELLYEVIRIIKPFAGKTMETIPHPAVAELFDLLARDKIIELADDFGVKVLNISLNGL